MRRIHSHYANIVLRNKGVTLVEVMIVIAIAGILLAIAIPSFSSLIQSSRVSTGTNSFIAAMNLARAEGLKRGGLVTICRSINAESGATACSTAASATPSGVRDSTDWSAGWLVFAEGSSTANVGVYDAADTVLLRQGALPDKIFGPSVGGTVLTFNGTGAPRGSFAGTSINFNSIGDYPREVCIARTGRTRVIRDVINCPAN